MRLGKNKNHNMVKFGMGLGLLRCQEMRQEHSSGVQSCVEEFV